jgi:hypothetical protein
VAQFSRTIFDQIQKLTFQQRKTHHHLMLHLPRPS